jgi:hypothetical protein
MRGFSGKAALSPGLGLVIPLFTNGLNIGCRTSEWFHTNGHHALAAMKPETELQILQKVAAITEPTMGAEANAIAPPSQLASLVDAGLIRGEVILGGNGMPECVVLLSLTYEGTFRLDQLAKVLAESRPTAQVAKGMVKVGWVIVASLISALFGWFFRSLHE